LHAGSSFSSVDPPYAPVSETGTTSMRAGKECAASSGFCRPRHKAPGKGDSLLIQGECWANQATLLDILRFTAQNLCNESGLPL
ncbi:hypothetical protein, partial [Paracoccus pantotrophus]|uniref:hypothetical protein n=1 Tax=Paracoccus pantotrophus TaxID=82367 RepID=UPI0035AF3EA1